MEIRFVSLLKSRFSNPFASVCDLPIDIVRNEDRRAAVTTLATARDAYSACPLRPHPVPSPTNKSVANPYGNRVHNHHRPYLTKG
jgi:hypothetical protein